MVMAYVEAKTETIGIRCKLDIQVLVYHFVKRIFIHIKISDSDQ